MKKGVIVVLVLLAVIVLVSPAIVGRMAEKSMDENLNWAAEEAGGISVTSQGFARSLLSSEGQHRVELEDGQILGALEVMGLATDPDELPVLIINTKLDHGLIPVSSMSREGGSLAPGLAVGVSTMQVELPDGQLVDLPGTIYSKVGLGGALHSNFVLEAGSHSDGDASASWGETNINVTTDPASGEVIFDGTVGPLTFGSAGEGLSVAALTFEGEQQPTDYGFATGDIAFELSDLTARSQGADATGVRSMTVNASTTLDGDRVTADAIMTMAMHSIPQVGEMSFDMDFSIEGADAASLGRIQTALENVGPAAQDPMIMYGTIESDLKLLFASGFDMNFDRLDITLPQGTVNLEMAFSFGEEDPATFDWSSLLLSTEADVNVSVPAALVDAAGQGNPQLAMAIGSGFLVKEGDAYIMKAQLKKGLATVNGAPIPIPLGGM